MAILGSKPWVNLLGNISTFRPFELDVFRAQKGVFSFQNIVKYIFLAYIAEKKKFEKCPLFDQNHGLPPLEKSQFFDFLNFLFLQSRKTVLRSKISLNPICWLILPKKKNWKNGHFWTKTLIFRLFELLVVMA